MDQMTSFVSWQIQMTQLERSRRAHQQHVRREHVTAAKAARPAAPSWSDRIGAILTTRMRPAAA